MNDKDRQILVKQQISKAEAFLSQADEMSFPHIPAHRKVSKEVLNMVIGVLPDDFDVEKETEKMWKEWAM